MRISTLAFLFTFLLFTMAKSSSAQTLFTYGSYKEDAKNFVRMYNANKNSSDKTVQSNLQQYLNLYIQSKLKVREALDNRLDTLPKFKKEINDIEKTLGDNYLFDSVEYKRLKQEAFARSQKDIHAAHIYISVKKADGSLDSGASLAKANAAYARLKKGDDFMKLASEVSDDPSAKINGGDLQYITVFSLPYIFENIVYGLKPGSYSAPIPSNTGYHIFKNIAERNAVGQMRIHQLLIAFPPNITEAEKKETIELGNQLYAQAIAGADYQELSSKYSMDRFKGVASKSQPLVKVGEFEASFDSLVFSLQKDEEIAKPIVLNDGVHIVKRIELIPPAKDLNNLATSKTFDHQLNADGRLDRTKDFIYKAVDEKIGVQKLPYSEASLYAFSDSVILYSFTIGIIKNINNETPLFRIGKDTLRTKAWVEFARYKRRLVTGAIIPYPIVIDQYLKSVKENYYKAHLPEMNDEYKFKFESFRDGNLFFDAMQRNVWNYIQDESQLQKWYADKKARYKWKPGAGAVSFSSTNKSELEAWKKAISERPMAWQQNFANFSKAILIDTGRYNWEEMKSKALPEGTLTEISLNRDGSGYQFFLIKKIVSDNAAQSFSEARPAIVADYQAHLEKQWEMALQKKYPVKINKQVLQNLKP